MATETNGSTSVERILLPEMIGDPVVENPFPVTDARHNVWKEATRNAEERVLRIRAQSLLSTSQSADIRLLTLIVEIFDAWAKRGVHVVWSDDALVEHDRWLAAYADGWIEIISEHFPREEPAPAGKLLLSLRRLLSARVQLWMAEARRYRADQEQHTVAQAAADTPAVIGYAPDHSTAEAGRAVSALNRQKEAAVGSANLPSRPPIVEIESPASSGAAEIPIEVTRPMSGAETDDRVPATRSGDSSQFTPQADGAHGTEREKRGAIAYAIDQCRQDCGWTIDALAEKMDMERSVVASHTTGAKTPRPRNLQRYAEVFSENLKREVTVGDLRRGKAEGN